MKRLAIIPARSGSKRIPGKNIRSFCGKPIIKYPIEYALKSGCFEEVMVSTDSKKIAQIAEESGASVPFFRSDNNSTDNATTVEVIREVVQEYSRNGVVYDIVCCIYPTSVFALPEFIKKSSQIIESKDVDSVVSIVKYSCPIQKALKLKNGKINMIDNTKAITRTQDLEVFYHDAGQFYWLKTEMLIKGKEMFNDNTFGFELSRTMVQDIDNEEDWVLAELKYEFLKKGVE